jgi:hypothetical protein
MDEIYLVPRAELLELLEARYRLAALECGGVDNWEWCGESLHDYLKDYVNENKHLLTKGMELEDAEEYLEDFDFCDMVEFEMDSWYEKYDKNISVT